MIYFLGKENEKRYLSTWFDIFAKFLWIVFKHFLVSCADKLSISLTFAMSTPFPANQFPNSIIPTEKVLIDPS